MPPQLFPMILISGFHRSARSSTCNRRLRGNDQLAIAKRCARQRSACCTPGHRIGLARAIRAAVSASGGVYLDLRPTVRPVMDAEPARNRCQVIDAAPRRSRPSAIKRALDVLKSAKLR